MKECSFLDASQARFGINDRCSNPVHCHVQDPRPLPDGTMRKFIPACAPCARVMVEAGWNVEYAR